MLLNGGYTNAPIEGGVNQHPQNQPGYAPPMMTENGPMQAAPSPTAAAPSNSIDPAYLSQIFPNGLPNASAAQTGIPTANAPTLMQLLGGAVPNVSGAQTNVALSPQDELNATLQSLMPIFGQQQNGLQDALANAGIVGGSTAGAMNDLARNQTQQATAAIAPLMQNAQSMQLQQALANAGNTQQAGEFNVGNLLNSQGQSAQQLLEQALANQQAGLQGGEFNAGSLNNANQFNIANALNAGEYDTGTFNQMLSQMLGYQNSDWLAQLQAQLGMNEGAAGGQTGAFQPIFTQPSSPNFMGLGAAFAPAAPAPNPGGWTGLAGLPW